MPHERSGENTDERGSNEGLLGRRTCLKGIGGVAASVGAVGVMTGSAAASTTRHGIEFERVTNVVDDLGCDPTGKEPVQDRIKNAEQEGTLFVFPDGEYLLTDRLLLMRNDVVGVLGKGNARFVVPENYNTYAVLIDRGQRLLFENMDLDLRADGATPGYKFGVHDRAVVRDVELVGQGIHPDSDPRGEGQGHPDVQNALILAARQPDSTVTVENFVARNDGLMGAYNHGHGRVGIWVGSSNTGTVTMRNCHVSGFPNNGLYTSRTLGVVQVEGGVFRDNDISQVRLGSEGSYVKGAQIEVDLTESRSPNPEDTLNARGVRIESGRVKTGGVTVRDCDIRIAEGVNSDGAIVVGSPGGQFDVINTRIQVDAKRTHGVLAREPDSGERAPPQPYHGRLRNVSITGAADRGQAIQFQGRENSVIDSCCIEQTGSLRDAVRLYHSDGTVVKDSTLNTTGRTYVLDGSNVDKWNNSASGSCPLPSFGSEAEQSAGTDSNDSEAELEEGSTDGPTKRIAISGVSRKVSYRIEVSGEISGTGTSEDGEVESSTVAAGQAGGWSDGFDYTGNLEKLVVKGAVTLIYDAHSKTLEVKNNTTGKGVSYEVHTSGNAWRTSGSNEENPPQSADPGKTFDGRVGGWGDQWGCSGDILSARVGDYISVVTEEI